MKKTLMPVDPSGGLSLPPQEFGLKVLLPVAAALVLGALVYGGWWLLQT